MAASDALALACVWITFVTSAVLHSGHRSLRYSSSQRVQLPDSSRKHAMSPRWESEIGTSTSDTEKAIQVAKIVVKRMRMAIIIMMKAQIDISLLRLCLVDMTGFALIYQPIMAEIKKIAAVIRKRGPIQVTSFWARVFKTEEFEKEKMRPKATQLAIGKLIHAGTFDSRDFWTRGREMMCSRTLTVRKSCDKYRQTLDVGNNKSWPENLQRR